MSEELTLEATSSGEHEKKSDWVNLYSQHFVRSRCGRNLGKTRENWYDHVPLFSDTGSLSKWMCFLYTRYDDSISHPVTGSKDKGVSFGNSEIQRAVSSRNKNANKDLYWMLLRKSSKKTRKFLKWISQVPFLLDVVYRNLDHNIPCHNPAHI